MNFVNSEEISESIAYVQGFRNFRSLFQRHTHFIISTHVNPDGDGLGSEIALHEFLESQNKKAYILNQDPTPERYHFLDFEGVIQHLTKRKLNAKLLSKCALIVVDANEFSRIGRVGHLLQDWVKEIFFIDHHTASEELVKRYFNLEQATATGELIYYIIRNLGGQFSFKSAQALYTAIMTDTGSFRFPKTDWKTHLIISELLKTGFNPNSVYQEVYENSTQGRLRILTTYLNNLTFEFGGRLAYSYITEEMLEQANADNEEMDGFVNMPLETRGVRVSIFVKHYRKQIKTALRSKGTIDVSSVAQELGGGGHFNASGFRLEATEENSVDRVKEKILKAFAVQFPRS